MPFVVSYKMLTGAAKHRANTAMDAANLYQDLRSAGASAIVVKADDGRVYSLADLLALAAPPIRSRDLVRLSQ